MSIFNIKIQNSDDIGASLILEAGQIGALQNSGNVLKIKRDWSLPLREIEVPRVIISKVERLENINMHNHPIARGSSQASSIL